MCASTNCTQHVLQIFLLVHDQRYYKCLAQLPLRCQTIGLPLSVAWQSIPLLSGAVGAYWGGGGGGGGDLTTSDFSENTLSLMHSGAIHLRGSLIISSWDCLK